MRKSFEPFLKTYKRRRHQEHPRLAQLRKQAQKYLDEASLILSADRSIFGTYEVPGNFSELRDDFRMFCEWPEEDAFIDTLKLLLLETHILGFY